MNSLLENILIGTISGIVASICYSLIIFRITAKKNIENSLEILHTAIYSFNSHLDYGNYTPALFQVDIILKEIMIISKYLSPIIYLSSKRKFLLTLISNLYRTTKIFKTLEMGYDGEKELIERCRRYKRKYLYTITDTPYNIITINLLNYSYKNYSLKKILKISRYNKYILKELIEINSFKTGNVNDELSFLKKDSFSKKEYERYTMVK